MRQLKQIHVKMIPPEGHRPQKTTFRAPPGQNYTPESEEQAIEKVVDYLDKTYRYWNFKMVKVGVGRYNFVYDGLRKAEEINHDSVDRDGSEQDRDVSEVQ